ncbi:MAG: hypothetical protein NZ853_03825 [Leptospiraceae bacterium]|nr:hypothetical protein [Leptospiraceae bacterium]MDW7975304.1 DUF6580 family putative transport protein [Leptospiraceae bacterium]
MIKSWFQILQNNGFKIFVVLLFVGIGVLSRLVDHIPNFTPIVGIGLFLSYIYGKNFSLAFVILTMLISDAFIGLGHFLVHATVYFSLMVPSFLGVILRKFPNYKWKYFILVNLSLISSVIFYLTTNFAVWLWGGLYEPTLDGLMMSYIMAIPFFKNTLAGDLFSSLLVFGVYDLIYIWLSKKETAQQDSKEIL